MKKKFAEDAPFNSTTTNNAINQMIDYLATRYAFRFNTITNCTEYRHTNGPADAYMPLDPRARRRITIEVEREGIEVSQNDIANYIGSDYIRAYDPVGDYLAQSNILRPIL